MGKTVVIMKQTNLTGIVERSSAMMEALSVQTDMFYRGYHTDIETTQYTSGDFMISVTIFCDNYTEQCEIAQYLEEHPARHLGTISTGAVETSYNYWIHYEIDIDL